MEDNNNNDSPTTTTTNLEPTARSRGRPRRPTAQKSVHQLVLNLTQNNEKKNQQNVNKKQKTSESEVLTTTPTTITTPKTTNDWKVGQKVEARDVAGDWYSAKIVSKSEDHERVLVHFERWSARYDQWFPRDSHLIREKSSSETSGASSEPEFVLHEEVLARWTDNRPYPATIVEVYAQQRSVLVLFFDGYRKKVKFSQIEKMPKHFSGLRVPQLKTGFEIKADHNDFKCHFDDCGKGFRKQSLLTQHLKHYHKSDDKCIIKTTEETTSEETPPIVIAKPIVVSKPTIIAKPVEKSVKEETTTTPVVTSRLKRKYVRKPLPNTAVRKSNRQMTQNDFCPLLTTVTTKETLPVVTPNTTLPFWDARTVAEIHETDPEELVNCVCDVKEESGLMVQCECCLCWQHANCMHFNAELDVPKDGYFCLSCRFPKNVRKCAKSAFLVNHSLKSGKRPQFPFSDEEKAERETLAQTNGLLGSALEMREMVWSLSRDLNKRDLIEKQSMIWKELESLEEKCLELEFNNDLHLNDSQIKNEISLMFEDLKNAKTLT